MNFTTERNPLVSALVNPCLFTALTKQTVAKYTAAYDAPRCTKQDFAHIRGRIPDWTATRRNPEPVFYLTTARAACLVRRDSASFHHPAKKNQKKTPNRCNASEISRINGFPPPPPLQVSFPIYPLQRIEPIDIIPRVLARNNERHPHGAVSIQVGPPRLGGEGGWSPPPGIEVPCPCPMLMLMLTFPASKACGRFLALQESCIHPTSNARYILSLKGGRDNSPEGLQVCTSAIYG